MSLTEHRSHKVFHLDNNQMQLTFSLQQTCLSIQLKIFQDHKVYDKMYTSQTYGNEIILNHYFKSYGQFYQFARHLNDQYINVDRNGKLELTIFGQELEEKTIEINLNQQNQIQTLQRIQSLQNAYAQLAKLYIKQKKKHEDEMALLRKDFQRMMIAHDTTTGSFQRELISQPGDPILRHKKHGRINITQNKIFNYHSNNYEIRWAIIGPQVSMQKRTLLKLKVNKVNWLALGFCHQDIIQSRKYTRLNGSGPHGAYVMDSYGWTFAHNDSTTNYKQLGFTINEQDIISVVFDPQDHLITFINHNSWQQYDLRLQIQGKGLQPCIACNMQTQIQILSYSK